jgi:hypothetical protein
MTYCAKCSALVNTKEENRCRKCGASLSLSDAVLSPEQLSQKVRSKNKHGNKWIFVVGGGLLSLIPCVLFLASTERFIVGFVLGCLSSFVLHYKFHSYFGSMLIFAVPQILFSGLNFFAWLGYLCIGYAIGIWKMSMRDMH